MNCLWNVSDDIKVTKCLSAWRHCWFRGVLLHVRKEELCACLSRGNFSVYIKPEETFYIFRSSPNPMYFCNMQHPVKGSLPLPGKKPACKCHCSPEQACAVWYAAVFFLQSFRELVQVFTTPRAVEISQHIGLVLCQTPNRHTDEDFNKQITFDLLLHVWMCVGMRSLFQMSPFPLQFLQSSWDWLSLSSGLIPALNSRFGVTPSPSCAGSTNRRKL